ncbi:MAG: nucleotidyltransferase domain-containing protein [Bacilli bacterium]|nr:nucleotidyltransferase domain-containing protein [Bacilli bacterium]
MKKNNSINDAVTKFIDKMNYLSNKDILGIVLYGSSITGYTHANSDIDIHIITSNNVKDLIRGVITIDNNKFEYFERPIEDVYKEVDISFKNQRNALLTMIGYGIILFDRNGEIKKLQQHILEKYANPLPHLEGDDAKEMVAILDNRLIKLQDMYDNNDIAFESSYFLLIERIRKFYSRRCGCSDIPPEKAVRVYSDEEYRQAFCKSNIPDKEFISLYFDALTQTNKEDKMKMAYKIFDYTKKDINLNPNDYRIRVKSRNDPTNINLSNR